MPFKKKITLCGYITQTQKYLFIILLLLTQMIFYNTHSSVLETQFSRLSLTSFFGGEGSPYLFIYLFIYLFNYVIVVQVQLSPFLPHHGPCLTYP